MHIKNKIQISKKIYQKTSMNIHKVNKIEIIFNLIQPLRFKTAILNPRILISILRMKMMNYKKPYNKAYSINELYV